MELAERTIGTLPILEEIPAVAGDLSIIEGRYELRLAADAAEIGSALRLRHRVFNVELGSDRRSENGKEIESDRYDAFCRHLIVTDRERNEVIGTYRLNTMESARNAEGFYSFEEFSIEELPQIVLDSGIEVGRACIAPEHRNTKVLYLLWKGLARFMQMTGKRFIFGCCSIFTRDELVGEKAFHQLADAGRFHDSFRVEPRRNALYLGSCEEVQRLSVELPSLFSMYLRVGAKVCGPPIIDTDFGTIDFFVVFDREEMTPKYRAMYF